MSTTIAEAPPAARHDAPIAARRRPSRWWYLCAACVAIVGSLAAASAATTEMLPKIDEMYRVRPGTSGYFRLEPGGYTLWLEREVGAVRSDVWVTNEVELSRLMGDPVTLVPTTENELYGWWGRVGIAVRTFEIVDAGVYRLRVGESLMGRYGPRQLVIVPDHDIALQEGSRRGVAAGFGAIGAAVALAAFVAVRRRQATPPAPMEPVDG